MTVSILAVKQPIPTGPRIALQMQERAQRKPDMVWLRLVPWLDQLAWHKLPKSTATIFYYFRGTADKPQGKKVNIIHLYRYMSVILKLLV